MNVRSSRKHDYFEVRVSVRVYMPLSSPSFVTIHKMVVFPLTSDVMVFIERVHKGDDDVFTLGSRFAHRPYPLPTTLTMKTRPALTLHPPELHFIVLLTEAVQAVGKHH